MAQIQHLLRVRVSFMVAVACACGFVLARGELSFEAFLAANCAFFLCAGCSVLNQVQEREQDRLMLRTAERPLVTGLLCPMAGTCFGCGLFFLGLGLGLLLGGIRVVPLCLAIPLLYNGLYTPLKKRTAFALLVGGIPGALPPALGWVLGGGAFSHPSLVMLTVMLYLWQVPHFWLLAEQNRADYERAGFVLPHFRLGSRQFRSLIHLWILGYFVAALVLPFALHLPNSAPWISAVAVVCGVGIGCAGVWRQLGLAFRWLNVSLPLFLFAIVLGT